MNLFKRKRRNSGPILEIATTQNRVGLFEDSLDGTRMVFSTVAGGQIGHWLDERADEGCETCIVDNTAIDENEPALRDWLAANPADGRKPRVVLTTSNRMPGDAYIESLAGYGVQCIYTQGMDEEDVPRLLAEALLDPSASLLGGAAAADEPETAGFMPVKMHREAAAPAAAAELPPTPAHVPQAAEPAWAPSHAAPGQPHAAAEATRPAWEPQTWAAPAAPPQEGAGHPSAAHAAASAAEAPLEEAFEAAAAEGDGAPEVEVIGAAAEPRDINRLILERRAAEHAAAQPPQAAPASSFAPVRAARHAAEQAAEAPAEAQPAAPQGLPAQEPPAPFRLSIEDVIKPAAQAAAGETAGDSIQSEAEAGGSAPSAAAAAAAAGDAAAAAPAAEPADAGAEEAGKRDREARRAAKEERRRENARLLSVPVRCIETGEVYENAAAAKAAVGKDILTALKSGQRAAGYTWETAEGEMPTNRPEGAAASEKSGGIGEGAEKGDEAAGGKAAKAAAEHGSETDAAGEEAAGMPCREAARAGCAIDVRRSMGLTEPEESKPTRIDVAGVHRGAGCSTLALAIALELRSLGKRPLLELATQEEVDDLGWALAGSETIYDGILYDGCLVAAPDSETSKRAHYDTVVRDLGCVVASDGKVPAPDEADASILLLGTSPWNIKACIDAFEASDKAQLAKRTLASRSECRHSIGEVARAYAELAGGGSASIARVPNLDYILTGGERHPEALACLIGDLAKRD